MKSIFSQDAEFVDWVADADYTAGDMIQMNDGRAGQITVSVKSGATVGVRVGGILVEVAKTSGFVAISGNPAFWDQSAGKVHYKKVNDRDFYVGMFTADGTAAGTDTTCSLEMNITPRIDIDLLRDPYNTTPVGTQALGGFLPPERLGGSLRFKLTATSEPQKADAISVNGFALNAQAFARFIVRFPAGGSASASDFSIGLANATHATDADAITDSIFFHVDGGSTAIKAECDDGTNETAATDTTTTFTAGTALANQKEFWIDLRNPADIQYYVDGVLVLDATTFTVAASVATWFILIHLEKTTGTETADLVVDKAEVRLRQAA